MAGRQASQTVTRYAGIQVQTSSTLGTNITRWAGARSAAAATWSTISTSNPQSQDRAAGKGGSNTTGYTYSATIILAVCEGPIDDMTQVWANGKQYVHGSNGSGAADTVHVERDTSPARPQFLARDHRADAAGRIWSPTIQTTRSATAVSSSSSTTTTGSTASASTPNHSFEVVRTTGFAVGGGYAGRDADPRWS